ncbi:ABC transporter substrate-binding protein [Arthrobacter psychrolactophilus]
MNRKKVMTTLATAATFGMLLAGCANTAAPEGGSSSAAGGGSAINIPALTSIDTPKDAVLPAGDGKATCADTTTLAYVGAQTGPNAQLGINIFNGVQLAINEHNTANPDCQVQFKKFDTEGDPNKATGPVTQATKEEGIIGVVGLPFSGESKATGNIFEQVKMVRRDPRSNQPGPDHQRLDHLLPWTG